MDIWVFWQSAIAVVISMTGRLASIYNMKDHSKITRKWILGQLFVAGFAGMLTLLLAGIAGWNGTVVKLVCGIAGWTSPAIVYAITKIAERILGLEENELKKRK